MAKSWIGAVLSAAGALVGGSLGLAAFLWLARNQGLYALVLPGAGVGLGCLMASTARSRNRGLIMAAIAMVFGLAGEWRSDLNPMGVAPFLKSLPGRNPIFLLMIAVGTALGFWWGRDESPWIGRRVVRAKP